MAKNWDAWFRCTRGSLYRAALGLCTLVVWSASQPEEQDEKPILLFSKINSAMHSLFRSIAETISVTCYRRERQAGKSLG